MWRAFFLAIGITMCVYGGESLLIDKAVLVRPPAAKRLVSITGLKAGSGRREITPPDWAPWSLLSAGAVVILYSFTIPRRVAT